MASHEDGTLYIVSTPIGNLGDVTYRAVETLRAVKLVAAEDTRRSRILLDHYQVATPLSSFNSYNQIKKAPQFIKTLKGGDAVALVSDAGTPGISDPLYYLVQQALEADIPVVSIPGPSSVMAALTVSGLPIDRFSFAGFLPRKKRRKATIESLAQLQGAVVLFESPNRLEKTLTELFDAFGDRQAIIARELTKLHEEIVRGSLQQLVDTNKGKKWKGEITLVIAGTGRGGKKASEDAEEDY
ncbi:16S rRNA (cytidine(1402)-2'-O)-methyltransferase [Nitrospina watsonii]|uniref:Ribosomal RNA small subunit methyltransferase I n=1 Tax=Nitrospina watsonii TaxID=1323948 RepID=A0ABM9HHH6_9BACT|nr:16S rRNA (cytidine(1402)-2'-O)-methyltransferase [Nitrospina watsonii]CAI2719720.1 Ribosomal RNA small subunit methyltransferase I [Nitrospina watsonii]